jgi:RND superfamily putative drug exporter
MSRTEATLSAPTRADQPPTRPKAAWIVVAIGVLWLLLGLYGNSFQAKLGDVQKNDNASWLPKSAQSTKVADESEKFSSTQTIPGFIVYQHASGLTAADKTKIAADAQAFRTLKGVAPDQVAPPVFSKDGTAAQISVPLIGKQNGKSVKGPDLVKYEKKVIKTAKDHAPPGLTVHSAGAGGLLVAFIDAFSGIDGALLITAIIVVVAILLVVYRSPILWIFPLLSAGVVGLGSAVLLVYQLAKHNVLTLNGQSQGILFVLVLGAGTDYALLLISRYREELHNFEHRSDAMIRAWKGAAPAIAASAITVILGLLCLTLGELNSDSSLGPVCAIGVACTAVAMLTFLPAALVVFGRWVFWPRVPHLDHQADIATHGLWGRFAGAIGRHARRSWIATAVALAICVIAISGLRTGGLTTTQSFTQKPEAIAGQKIFDKNFGGGQGAPADITVAADKADAVIAAVGGVNGVAHSVTGEAQVCIRPDYKRLADAFRTGTPVRPDARGCFPGYEVRPVGGRTLIEAQITDRYDTPAAAKTIQRIRSTVSHIDGAHALVGGQTAVTYDIQQASRHDRNLIIPIVLAVILVVLGLLLRAIVAPLLLIATVVLSFTATLGVSALVFNHVFHFANADPSFPLFAFIFLVALGIDYNIFLMTRVREEALKFGTRQGILRGLSVTGGVITSAGVVLAATFTVLGVLPLVGLAEIGFAVAFGVLLDTIVVRSILVPALSHEIGKKIWWPSKLALAAD